MNWEDKLEKKYLDESMECRTLSGSFDTLISDIESLLKKELRKADANARMEQDIINFNSWLEKEEKVMKIAKIDECQKILTDRSIFNMPTKIQNLLLERISELEGGSE